MGGRITIESKWQVKPAARFGAGVRNATVTAGLREDVEYFWPMTKSPNGSPFILQL